MKNMLVVLFLCFSFSSLHAQNPVTLKSDGDKALAAKQYAVALVDYEKALTVWGKRPTDNAMIYAMGTCSYSINDMKKAMKYFDMSIAAGFNLDMAYQYKACVMTAQKNNDGYVQTLKEGLNKVPNSKAMKVSLSKYYDSEGDKLYHTALEILKNAVAQVNAGKLSSSDNAFKSENEKARHELNDAIKLFNQSLELTPNEESTKKAKSNCQTQLQMLI
jgi:tetratricopeptide (TPR) repeat protein